jgi:hypothetical protein
LKCVDICLSTTFQDNIQKACLPCHESCLTCDAPYSSTNCLSCADQRKYNSTAKTCYTASYGDCA